MVCKDLFSDLGVMLAEAGEPERLILGITFFLKSLYQVSLSVTLIPSCNLRHSESGNVCDTLIHMTH